MKITLLRIFIRFLGFLPLPLLRALGASAGWLLYRMREPGTLFSR